MLFVVVAAAALVPFVAPYDVASVWGDVSRWTDLPRNAPPDWIDAFSEQKFARTIIVDWNEFKGGASNTTEDFKIIVTRARWKFEYDTFPPDMRVYFRANWSSFKPLITITWERPDGEKITMFSGFPTRQAPLMDTFDVPADTVEGARAGLEGRLREWAAGFNATDVAVVHPHVTLYAETGPDMLSPARASVLHGPYALTVEALAFDANDTLEARFVSYGGVYGLAGTDSLRRDHLVGLLWGAPVALAFGAVAAVLTVMAQVILGALGAYYGGRFDEVIQRATDFVIIIPVLPILILIGFLYRPDLVRILLIIVAFNVVGGTTKVIRSIALQVKEESYIEAARAYGASRARILFRYIIPRTMPYTFALMSLSVPAFIFLEASLSFLGVGDPVLPTWGSIMGDASRGGAIYNGLWWWVALPASGIVFITVAFAFLGYAFDKVLNPRLREE